MSFPLSIPGSNPAKIAVALCGLANVVPVRRRSLRNSFVMVTPYATTAHIRQPHGKATLHRCLLSLSASGRFAWRKAATVTIATAAAPS